MKNSLKSSRKNRIEVGIDEAGRGPLAGPVTVCALLVYDKEFLKQFPKNCDSKLLSSSDRQKIRKLLDTGKKAKKIMYCVVSIRPSLIDTKGIECAIQRAIITCLRGLEMKPDDLQVFLDGRLRAPSEYIHQKTIIKGDSKKQVIGLASIVAKTTRDAHMVNIAKKYPQYYFDVHKGYGTRLHRDMIIHYGVTPIHRKSFLRKIMSNSLD